MSRGRPSFTAFGALQWECPPSPPIIFSKRPALPGQALLGLDCGMLVATRRCVTRRLLRETSCALRAASLFFELVRRSALHMFSAISERTHPAVTVAGRNSCTHEKQQEQFFRLLWLPPSCRRPWVSVAQGVWVILIFDVFYPHSVHERPVSVNIFFKLAQLPPPTPQLLKSYVLTL